MKQKRIRAPKLWTAKCSIVGIATGAVSGTFFLDTDSRKSHQESTDVVTMEQGRLETIQALNGSRAIGSIFDYPCASPCPPEKRHGRTPAEDAHTYKRLTTNEVGKMITPDSLFAVGSGGMLYDSRERRASGVSIAVTR